MNVLGLSAHFHDASAALLVDGKVVAAAAEERFSRQRHDANFPRYAIDFCLKRAALEAGQLDAVVFYEEPHVKFTRVLASTIGGFPWSRKAFVGAMKGWLSNKLFIRDEISRGLDIHPRIVRFVPHHQSHATHAFLSSPFDEAAIMTVDAVGEWTTTSLAVGRRGESSPVKMLDQIQYPSSLGLVYAAFTAFLGFRPNCDECSTMAVSTFGRPTWVDKVREVVKLHRDGTYEVDRRYFDFLATDRPPFTRRFLKLFGEPARPGDLACLDSLAAVPASLPEPTRRLADIAASVQLVLEEALLGLARRLHEQTGLKKLCLAGGVALNCVANRRLLRDGPFESIYIPPDPGDGGGAMGAAMVAAAELEPEATHVGQGGDTPYLGQSYDSDPFRAMLDELDPEVWERRGPGVTTKRTPSKVTVTTLAGEANVTERAVDLLSRERIVGWVQGRFETGPRALGNRSLLAAPGSLDTARRMSQTVKRRAPYRPYAFAIASEAAAGILELPEGDQTMPRWMQVVTPVREDTLADVRGATHCDGTTRPQVCSAADNPRFHALLTAYGQAKGPPALLNTSLNERGLPMAASPVEALAMFARTEMDALIVDNTLIEKVW